MIGSSHVDEPYAAFEHDDVRVARFSAGFQPRVDRPQRGVSSERKFTVRGKNRSPKSALSDFGVVT